MFVIFNIIYKQKTALGYSLFIKSIFGDKTKKLITKLIHTQLIVSTIKIKKPNRYIDPKILAL